MILDKKLGSVDRDPHRPQHGAASAQESGHCKCACTSSDKNVCNSGGDDQALKLKYLLIKILLSPAAYTLLCGALSVCDRKSLGRLGHTSYMQCNE